MASLAIHNPTNATDNPRNNATLSRQGKRSNVLAADNLLIRVKNDICEHLSKDRFSQNHNAKKQSSQPTWPTTQYTPLDVVLRYCNIGRRTLRRHCCEK
jgi:hypothetical protein